MIFQHARFQIWNANQHPYKHSLEELTYTNEGLPEGNVFNAKQAIDWLVAVLYPRIQPAVDTPVDLPLVGNTLNDYRVVSDDGDGKAAAYRWQQLEGDVNPQWYKIYDMDWGEQSVLSNFLLKTQDVYAYKYGIDDLDETGTPYAGDLAGQRIYGGSSANTHLTLYANSGDGVGAGTGYVQFGDNVRPLIDSSFSLGTDTYRFLNIYSDAANIGTMLIQGGSITDSSGIIDFGNEELRTTGIIRAGQLVLQTGSITDGTGTISFDNENLTTSGTGTFGSVSALGAPSSFASGTTIGTLTLADGSITDTGGSISFGNENLDTTGSMTANSFIADLTTLDNNAITTSAGDFAINPFGFLNIGTSVFVTGDVDLSGDLIIGPADNLIMNETGVTSDMSFSIVTTAGDIEIMPFSGVTIFASDITPDVDNTYDIGAPTFRWVDLYLSDVGTINDGTLSIAVATIMSFRDALVGAGNGMSLFYDNGTGRWLASLPDTEIDHGSISGLADDDHTQYALLAGRSGGQTLSGGIAASNNLILDSTTNVTKGQVRFASDLSPTSDLGVNLGTSSLRFDDLYMGGEAIGMRLQNVTSGGLPAASASNVGRVAWATDTDAAYVDTGGTWKKLVSDKYVTQDAVNWDGTNTSQAYNVSSQFDDAREALWGFHDNTNGFREVNGAVITKTASTVTVTFTIPPPAGTYTLVGVG